MQGAVSEELDKAAQGDADQAEAEPGPGASAATSRWPRLARRQVALGLFALDSKTSTPQTDTLRLLIGLTDLSNGWHVSSVGVLNQPGASVP